MRTRDPIMDVYQHISRTGVMMGDIWKSQSGTQPLGYYTVDVEPQYLLVSAAWDGTHTMEM